METWMKIVMLSVGGVLGVNARYWLAVWINRSISSHFPWATFVINVSGSFAIGFLTMLLAPWLPHSRIRLLLLTGFLGGYTTFSTFSIESVALWEKGAWKLSLANMIGSVVAGALAVVLGIALARDIVIPILERSSSTLRQAELSVISPSESIRDLNAASVELTLPEDEDEFGRNALDANDPELS